MWNPIKLKHLGLCCSVWSIHPMGFLNIQTFEFTPSKHFCDSTFCEFPFFYIRPKNRLHFYTPCQVLVINLDKTSSMAKFSWSFVRWAMLQTVNWVILPNGMMQNTLQLIMLQVCHITCSAILPALTLDGVLLLKKNVKRSHLQQGFHAVNFILRLFLYSSCDQLIILYSPFDFEFEMQWDIYTIHFLSIICNINYDYCTLLKSPFVAAVSEIHNMHDLTLLSYIWQFSSQIRFFFFFVLFCFVFVLFCFVLFCFVLFFCFVCFFFCFVLVFFVVVVLYTVLCNYKHYNFDSRKKNKKCVSFILFCFVFGFLLFFFFFFSFFFLFHKSTAQVLLLPCPWDWWEERGQWIPPAPFSLPILYYNHEHGA